MNNCTRQIKVANVYTKHKSFFRFQNEHFVICYIYMLRSCPSDVYYVHLMFAILMNFLISRGNSQH